MHGAGGRSFPRMFCPCLPCCRVEGVTWFDWFLIAFAFLFWTLGFFCGRWTSASRRPAATGKPQLFAGQAGPDFQAGLFLCRPPALDFLGFANYRHLDLRNTLGSRPNEGS